VAVVDPGDAGRLRGQDNHGQVEAVVGGDDWTRYHREEIYEPWLQGRGEVARGGKLDVRVSRALGEKGYDKVRLSVITESAEDEEMLRKSGLAFEYSKPFQYGWEFRYDLGRVATACSTESVRSNHKVTSDSACRDLCSTNADCAYYTYYKQLQSCALASEACKLTKAQTTATYRKVGRRTLHSKILSVKPGTSTEVDVAGTKITIQLPREDGPTSGIVWADPDVSSRWRGSNMIEDFEAFNRSHEMINAITASTSGLDFFQIVGDTFYDQDGRITSTLMDEFSEGTKSKFWMLSPGNHDIWVEGTPSQDTGHDQHAMGFMQYYAQDTVASLTHDVFDLTVDPATIQQPQVTSDNFFWFNKIGNLGFVGFTSSAQWSQVEPRLEQACAYFANNPAAAVFLVAHWDIQGLGASADMAINSVRERALTIPGCDIGDRLKFVTGHRHCNIILNMGVSEPVGFLVGAHGLSTLGEKAERHCHPLDSQFGFLYIETTEDEHLRIHYFEEANTLEPSALYDKLLKCVRSNGAGLAGCTHLATTWLSVKV
ncbi:Hypothetical protein SCF082_LOCUS6309, partial [Durusdinium trenchii]